MRQLYKDDAFKKSSGQSDPLPPWGALVEGQLKRIEQNKKETLPVYATDATTVKILEQFLNES